MTSQWLSSFWWHMSTLWWHTKWSQYFTLNVSTLCCDPECLHSAGIRTRLSSLWCDPECLPSDAIRRLTKCLLSDGTCLTYAVTRSVYLVQGLWLSTLCWDMDCLLCAVTLTHREDKVSTLWLHTDCLLSDGICLHYDGIVSSLWCQSDLSTLWRLLSTLCMASVHSLVNWKLISGKLFCLNIWTSVLANK